MDSLRPDSDELTLYKNRKSTSKNAKQSPGKPHGKVQVDKTSGLGGGAKSRVTNTNVAGGAASRAGVANPSVGLDREPIGGRVERRHGSQSSSPVLVWVLLLVILSAMSGFAYLYWEQSQTIKNLEERLISADEFIGQSKLLFARLEGEVSETGAGLIEAGASAEKKLAFLESEVRKLWGVSYDRNRKTLQNHEKKLDDIGSKVASAQKSASSQATMISNVQKEAEKELSILDSRLSSLSGELSITRAEQGESLTQLEQRIVSTDAKFMEFEAQMTSMKKEVTRSMESQEDSLQSLSSIDESRRQLIKRVVDLEARLNKLSAVSTESKANLP